jgi:DNA-binding LacI/PurR family transcriptional regulator
MVFLNHSEGLNMMKRKDITLRDIAQQAHVSTATISRYFNHPDKISKSLRNTIEQILNQMNYNLKKQKPAEQNISIGLLVPDISNPWFTLLIKSIENSANIMGFSIILVDSNNDPSVEKSNFFRLIEKGVDGLIVIPTENNATYMYDFIDEKFPIIFLDRCINKQGVYYITSDNMQGAYQATKYLISLGHKSILYIGGNKLIIQNQSVFRVIHLLFLKQISSLILTYISPLIILLKKLKKRISIDFEAISIYCNIRIR